MPANALGALSGMQSLSTIKWFSASLHHQTVKLWWKRKTWMHWNTFGFLFLQRMWNKQNLNIIESWLKQPVLRRIKVLVVLIVFVYLQSFYHVIYLGKYIFCTTKKPPRHSGSVAGAMLFGKDDFSSFLVSIYICSLTSSKSFVYIYIYI